MSKKLLDYVADFCACADKTTRGHVVLVLTHILTFQMFIAVKLSVQMIGPLLELSCCISKYDPEKKSYHKGTTGFRKLK